ncbi:hypothetical protein P3L10_011166 [Capsicum annuum]
MNFTKILTWTFLIMIFVANSNAVSGKKLCALKCAIKCFHNPVCIAMCLKDCYPLISSKAFNCTLACSMERCSKFKEDDELMGGCWDECSKKYCI